MSPEANLKDDPTTAPATATGANAPTVTSSSSKPVAPKKRSEAENVIEGHADSMKLEHGFPVERRRRDGRLVGIVGFLLAAGIFSIIFWRHGARFTDLTAAYHARTWPMRISSIFAVIFLIGIVAPVPFHRIWMDYVAAGMGFVMTRVILTLAFFLGFTPYAIVMKLIGHDPLARYRKADSYWVKRDKRDPKHFEHLF